MIVLHQPISTYSKTLGVNLNKMHIPSGMDEAERKADDALYRQTEANSRGFAERARAARGQAKPCRVQLPSSR